ncbi:MAG: hypothetical protein HYU44_00250 [Betaproteobacteria bacterium]|nr:hypothetical protein [Betaproteobacteria bacterium]
MAQQMSQSFDQSVVVDNRPGAGGNIGEEMIVRATPDGYTLGLVSGYGTNAAIYKLSFDPVNDVQAVNCFCESESRQAQLRVERHRRHHASGHGALRPHGGHPHDAHSVQRHRSRTHCAPRQSGRDDVRQHAVDRASRQSGQAARNRGHHRSTGERASGDADHR